jgi:hypothetical protein
MTVQNCTGNIRRMISEELYSIGQSELGEIFAVWPRVKMLTEHEHTETLTLSVQLVRLVGLAYNSTTCLPCMRICQLEFRRVL